MRARPAERWPWLLAVLTVSCATAASVSIERLGSTATAPGPSVTATNVGEQLDRGRFPEVEAYLRALPPADLARSGTDLSRLGRALFARGDFQGARESLSAALERPLTVPERAEAQWALAQTDVLADDFRSAAGHTSEAIDSGLSLSPGFLRFLEGLAGESLYAGVSAGTRLETGFESGLYDLVRVPVTVNGRPVSAVLDTGASYCILTRSFARETGLVEIADSDAFGLGLHHKPIPLTFGVVQALTLAGTTLQTVPVMVMPDEALSFTTERGPLPLAMVLGLHLLKEFSVEIDYAGQHLTLTRLPPRPSRASPDQNLFFARGKVFVRVAVDRNAPSLFLLDTGSELTMLTAAGVRRLQLRPSVGMFPKRVEGIGRARVSWGKVDRAAIALSDWRLVFRDIVVAETEEALEDGVLGASALLHFRVRIDFGAMTLSLEERHS
ncbi:MAG TPA: aspartyl protease family protein [Thermoanaerobaculia bacterium]